MQVELEPVTLVVQLRLSDGVYDACFDQHSLYSIVVYEMMIVGGATLYGSRVIRVGAGRVSHLGRIDPVGL